MGFENEVGADGYAWWYVDALSADGRFGLTVIAFVGGVFSPYYAAARRRGPADPMEHCALNVCLYQPGATRWTLTERSRGEVERSAESFRIGPSALRWDGQRLHIAINEATPLRRLPVRGEIVVTPDALQPRSFLLDAAGRHRWRPISARAQVEVRLEQPELDWRGEGYLDRNTGSAPLDRDFRDWTWGRTVADADGRAQVFYDVRERSGERRSLALRLTPGLAEPGEPAPARDAAPSVWGMRRRIGGSARSAHVVRAFEDAPFYSRSSLRADLDGRPCLMMHEVLSLTRFRSPLMQWALPYRIPRSSGVPRRVRWAQGLISLATWP